MEQNSLITKCFKNGQENGFVMNGTLTAILMKVYCITLGKSKLPKNEGVWRGKETAYLALYLSTCRNKVFRTS